MELDKFEIYLSYFFRRYFFYEKMLQEIELLQHFIL